MIPKQALKLVHAQGYKPNFLSRLSWAYLFTDAADPEMLLEVRAHLALIALDPTFWQALGKALGWSEYDITGSYLYERGEEEHDIGWVVNALAFHRLILTGGDTEKFWADLFK